MMSKATADKIYANDEHRSVGEKTPFKVILTGRRRIVLEFEKSLLAYGMYQIFTA